MYKVTREINANKGGGGEAQRVSTREQISFTRYCFFKREAQRVGAREQISFPRFIFCVFYTGLSSYSTSLASRVRADIHCCSRVRARHSLLALACAVHTLTHSYTHSPTTGSEDKESIRSAVHTLCTRTLSQTLSHTNSHTAGSEDRERSIRNAVHRLCTHTHTHTLTQSHTAGSEDKESIRGAAAPVCQTAHQKGVPCSR